MVREIRIYFEGDRALQPAFGVFLAEARERARARNIRWSLIACGSRSRAFLDFQDALDDHPEAFNLLLVDSEEPVVQPPWEHLRCRQQDQWTPPRIDDSHCHLMVQMMEGWFVADVQALKDYYKKGFNAKVIPKGVNVEQIEKEKIDTALHEATRKTSKGKYDKTKHAPEILQRLNVAKVRKAAPHCDRLFKTLTEITRSLGAERG
jgi:hypothetical protein